ncbi:MAG: hypothetical protein QXQ40_00875 [Candidatus Aenigmatarchaeota archaeon]
MATKKQIRKVREMTLLEQGFIPKQSKLGTEFKGKNRIIIGR